MMNSSGLGCGRVLNDELFWFRLRLVGCSEEPRVLHAADEVGAHAHVLALVAGQRDDTDVPGLDRVREVAVLRRVLVAVPRVYLQQSKGITPVSWKNVLTSMSLLHN